MNYIDWKPWYNDIAAKLHLKTDEDAAATIRLSDLLSETSNLEEPFQLLHDKIVIILGAGPSLERDVFALRATGVRGDSIIACADGATSAFLQVFGSAPDVIFTDLDGDMQDIIYANRKGAVVIIHGHGDNIDRLNQYVPLLRHLLVGTTQLEPHGNIFNFGGFTDGDRAAFAAEANGADLIVLGGMDFGGMVGPYSKPRLRGVTQASWRKRMKLQFAKKLVEWLAMNGQVQLVNCTTGGEDLRGIPRISWEKAEALLP